MTRSKECNLDPRRGPERVCELDLIISATSFDAASHSELRRKQHALHRFVMGAPPQYLVIAIDTLGSVETRLRPVRWAFIKCH